MNRRQFLQKTIGTALGAAVATLPLAATPPAAVRLHSWELEFYDASLLADDFTAARLDDLLTELFRQAHEWYALLEQHHTRLALDWGDA